MDARCAHCSAALRPGAPWCTQCYAPTAAPAPVSAPAAARPAAVPAPRSAPDTARPGTAGSDGAPVARRTPADDGATWPCEACGARSPLADAVCVQCGAAFLAHAREPRPALVLPLVGDVSRLTPLRLVAVALALVVGLLLAGLVAGALLG